MTDAESTPLSSDIAAAIEALGQSQAVLGERSDELAMKLAEIDRQRQLYLVASAAQLLPAISGRVLDVLREQVPGFVTTVVEQSFASHGKFLGLFAGRGYAEALTLLQTRLASHLDQIRFGDIRKMDAEAVSLGTKKAAIDARLREARELQHLLKAAQERNIPLPATTAEQVGRIVRAAGTFESIPVKPKTVSHASDDADASSDMDSDDTDLWFYLLTDIPVSARTLLADALAGHGRDQGGHRHAEDPAQAVAASECGDAATDDSLGCFS